MNNDSKMGLRNASNILNKLKSKYLKTQPQQSQYLPHNKTFIEEEQSLELYEQHSQMHDKQSSFARTAQKQQKSQEVEQISAIKTRQKKLSNFCDKLIQKKLQQSLQVYQEDLSVMYQNRKYLEESIELLAEKIRKIRQLEANNKILAVQNAKLKEFLNQLIASYHQSNKEVFRAQIAQQESYNGLRAKIRRVLKEYREDYKFVGFVEYWNRYVSNSILESKEINQKIERQRKRQEEDIKAEQNGKFKKIYGAPIREKQFQQEFQSPEEFKPKKRLSQSEKASLVGDLKSFAKNFKFSSK